MLTINLTHHNESPTICVIIKLMSAQKGFTPVVIIILVVVVLVIGGAGFVFNSLFQNKPQEDSSQDEPQKLYPEDIKPETKLGKPFNFYILKELAGGIYLFELSKTGSYSPLNGRQVFTKDGEKVITVVVGYRAIYSSPNGDYFAKMHIDKGIPDDYEKDVLIAIDEIKYATHGNESLVKKNNYGSYEYYFREVNIESEPKIFSQGLIFSPQDKIIVTIYFLVPDPKAKNFGIPDLNKYRQQQERFIHEIIDSVKAGNG